MAIRVHDFAEGAGGLSYEDAKIIYRVKGSRPPDIMGITDRPEQIADTPVIPTAVDPEPLTPFMTSVWLPKWERVVAVPGGITVSHKQDLRGAHL